MNKNIKISIILPNYNSEKYLIKTIKSILNQTFKYWELIIVDDNSNFETIKILKKLKNNKKIKIFFLNKNKGDGYCRKFGIKKSKSKLVAFIDSDDIWNKNKLKIQYNFMKKNNFSFSYTNYTPFKNNRHYLNTICPPKKLNLNSFLRDTSIATSSMMINKKLLNNLKLSKSPNFEDYFLKCQILKKINFAYCIQKNLLNYRIKKQSLSKSKLRNVYWLWKINREFNKLSFLKNIISLSSVSYNSIMKYGFK